METRPDGTPGSLAAYAPKPRVEVFVPGEPAIMIALATRPSPWRMVNTLVNTHGTGNDWASTGSDGIGPVGVGEDDTGPSEIGSRTAETSCVAAKPENPVDSVARPMEPAAGLFTGRGPLDPRERIFTGDALSRFASARFDPEAPIEPLVFEDEDSIVELELINTGRDPEAEAERARMIAAHPEGKPIVTFRHGNKKPPGEPDGER
jgi:hypothetical protein